MNLIIKQLFLLIICCCLSSCMVLGLYTIFNGQEEKYVKDSRDIKQLRHKVIDGIYTKIKSITKTDDTDIIFELDLLRLSSIKSNNYCPISYLYFSLNDVSKKLDINQISANLQNYTNLSTDEVYEVINENIKEKMSSIHNIFSNMKIDDNKDLVAILTNVQNFVDKYKDIKDPDVFELTTEPESYRKKKLDAVKDKLEILEELNNFLQTLPLINPMPGGQIFDYYGYKLNPESIKLERSEGMNFINADNNQFILTSGKGIISKIEEIDDSKYLINIEHGNNFSTNYIINNTSKILVKENDKVSMMQPIAIKAASESYFYYATSVNKISFNPVLFYDLWDGCNYSK